MHAVLVIMTARYNVNAHIKMLIIFEVFIYLL